jgi:arylsulfatase A-like enzyme
MNPKPFLWSLILLAGAIVGQESATKIPNILFILADDLGYRELGCFGQQRIRTPHLDQLAKEGMRLTRHYAGSPVCAPSRAVLLTGKHPGHAAIRDNREAKPEGQLPLPKDEPCLAEGLAAQGYATAAFGKWGLGMFGSSGDPLQRGFARFFGYNCQRHAHSYWPGYLYDNAERIALANNPPIPGHARLSAGADPADPHNQERFVGTDYAVDRIQQAALAFLRTPRDKPFFLYYPTPLPHLALQVPAKDLKEYDGSFPETPYTGNHSYTPHATPRAAYAAMITRLDRDVGELLATLDQLGLRQQTLVVFTSDNGATHSPVGGTDVDFFASCGELRGRKGSLHEGGIRVPTIVRWPAVVPAGSSSAALSGFEDWLPTLMEVAGQRPLAGDGQSLLPILRGDNRPERPFLYREFAGYGGWQAVWSGEWKLMRRQLQQGPVQTELFQLANDPAEATNLAAEEPKRVRELLAILQREHTPSATFPLAQIDGK